jgi:hypothetical protein
MTAISPGGQFFVETAREPLAALRRVLEQAAHPGDR